MTPINRYRDRSEAGQALARQLAAHAGRDDTQVLALPRGGVPVAAEIARALHLPLDIFVVRKIGHPNNPEFAIGAVASGGIQLLDESLVAAEKIPAATIDTIVRRETAELARRETLYRGDHPRPQLDHRRIILVDDGVATGYSLRVAILALQRLHPAHLTVAFPVGAPETCAALASTVDELVCPVQPSPFHAVGLWYDHFPPVSDEEVNEAVAQTARPG
jgi:putative phosphoribosyl transferase